MSRLVGGLLLAAGILIATLSGLCSLTFIATMMAGTAQNYRASDADGFLFALMVAAIFGGPPIGLGALLIVAGRRILRRHRSIDPSDVF